MSDDEDEDLDDLPFSWSGLVASSWLATTVTYIPHAYVLCAALNSREEQHQLILDIARMKKFPGYISYLACATVSDIANHYVERLLRSFCEKYCNIKETQKIWWVETIIGAVEGVIHGIVTQPIEIIQLRELAGMKFTEGWDGWRSILASLSSGLLANLIHAGLMGGLFNGLHCLTLKFIDEDDVWKHLGLYLVSAYTSLAIAAPMDLARRALQMQGQGNGLTSSYWPPGSGEGGKYMGIRDCLSSVAQRDGWMSLLAPCSVPRLVMIPIHLLVVSFVQSSWPAIDNLIHKLIK